ASLHSFTLIQLNGRLDNTNVLDSTLVAGNVEVFARLRLFHFNAHEPGPALFASLSLLVNLTYMGITLDCYDNRPTVPDDFIAALGCMPHLRVLITDGFLVPKVVAALPDKCPQLHHLGLRNFVWADAQP